MHAVMAILYGAFIITLLPHWLSWNQGATQFLPQPSPLAPEMIGLMTLMGVGVSLAGVRDLILSTSFLPASLRTKLAFPWSRQTAPPLIVTTSNSKQENLERS